MAESPMQRKQQTTKASFIFPYYLTPTVLLKDANVKIKEKSTLSRSSGCVQQAAPALPNPPKYHLATILVFCCADSDAIVTAVTLKNTAHSNHTAQNTDQDR